MVTLKDSRVTGRLALYKTREITKRNRFLYFWAKLVFLIYRRTGMFDVLGDATPKCRSVILATNGILPKELMFVEFFLPSEITIGTNGSKKNPCKALFNLIKQINYELGETKDDQETLKKFLEGHKKTKTLVISSEEHKSPDGKLGQPTPDFGLICYHTQVPVFPLYLDSTKTPLTRFLPGLKRTKIRMRFGRRIFLRDLYRRKGDYDTFERINNRVTRAILDLQKELANQTKS